MSLIRPSILSLFLFYFGISQAASLSSINPVEHFLSNLAEPSNLNSGDQLITVSTPEEFYLALAKANNQNNITIVLRKGVYKLPKTAIVTGTNISIIGLGSSPFDVVLRGNGMKRTANVDNLFWVAGNNFLMENLTLEKSGNHLIQLVSEKGGDSPRFRNVVFQDAFEQLMKVSFNKSTPEHFSKSGLVESCLFRYTKGIGPNWYIGGIDAHGIQNWVIKNNTFSDIASPQKHIAEHAIHLWNATKHNDVNGNLILNSDRGIGFGMRKARKPNYLYSNLGGTIENNKIFHFEPSDPFADVGIILEDSPDTVIKNNRVELFTSYPNAIEVRFKRSKNVTVIGNFVNKKIKPRDGAEPLLIENARL